MKALLLTTLAFLAAALVAGCGSSDDATATLTKAQYVSQANVVCARIDQEQQSAIFKWANENRGRVESKAGKEEVLLEVGLPPLKLEAEELSELGVPKGDKETAEEIVAGLEEAIEEVEKDPLSMARLSGGPFAEVSKLAASYGLEECADVL